jgi:nucleotide-binding universal stress UspA family protein
MSELQRILVPMDGSVLAERALPMAMSLARKFDSQIILLRVLDGLLMSKVSNHYPYAASLIAKAREQAGKDAEIYLKGHQQELCQQGFKVEILVREDSSPAEAIVDIATIEKVDLIVMTTRGLGGLTRWTIGSIADKVARHSPCPVMLIRPPSPPESTPLS